MERWRVAGERLARLFFALCEYYAVFRPTLAEERRAFGGIVLVPRF
jgi:hypothetical protein